MENIKISLSIGGNNDITIKNDKTGNSFVVEYASKVLNAGDVYSVFDFHEGYSYSVESDMDTIGDKNISAYYADIVNLFKEIGDELNKIVPDGDKTD